MSRLNFLENKGAGNEAKISKALKEHFHVQLQSMQDAVTVSALFYSPTGIIPVEYRPSTPKLTTAWVVTGYVNPVVNLRANENRQTFPGACVLSTNGTLSFGASLQPNEGPVGHDGLTLTPLQGPHQCGILAQTLIFNLD